MQLHNTLTRSLEKLVPLQDKQVKLYTCGPTVYDYQHIGNYSGYIYWDVLVRFLNHSGYSVDWIMNITDVGHLVSDDDEGEDKLEKGAKREGKTAREVADFFTSDFLENVKRLNITQPKQFPKATDYITDQVEIVQLLLDKGFAYQTEQAIYFDVTKLDDYGKLTGQKLSEKEIGARSEVVTDEAKHHPQDFALWFFTVGRFADHEMHWDSPWGTGFPGWHLECSAIIHSTLGQPIDIHAGGVDHIGTHHTNEIAQSEAAYEVPLAKIWIHNNHMMVDGHKISKSLGNGHKLDDLEANGFSPEDFRMFVLQSHYRSSSQFSWDNLSSAKARLDALYAMADLQWQATQEPSWFDLNVATGELTGALSDDLNTPKALAALSSVASLTEEKLVPESDLDSFKKYISTIDQVLGFNLSLRNDIDDQIKVMIKAREGARNQENWALADELRAKLEEHGILVRDTSSGSIWSRVRALT